MDQPVKAQGRHVAFNGHHVYLPMPVLVVVEDVGWWQGYDGSRQHEPFRNNLNRRHCLADYQALARLAGKLSTRLIMGMVLCEWDRTNHLKTIPGSTWKGSAWDNSPNVGPWLDQAADYINSRSDQLEMALHGVGHEFWSGGRMHRSEFHDADGRMRDRSIVKQHLTAFFELMNQNRLAQRPRIFIPPALNHSFGNNTIHPILEDAGIDLVITRFFRARQHRIPQHTSMAWESNVLLVDRGGAVVPWHEVGAEPVWKQTQPILPFHWANLLHEDPGLNKAVVDAWADMILEKINGPEKIMAKDTRAFLSQAGVFHWAKISLQSDGLILDLSNLPDLSALHGEFVVNICCQSPVPWQCLGGKITSTQVADHDIQTLHIVPDKDVKTLKLLKTTADCP